MKKPTDEDLSLHPSEQRPLAGDPATATSQRKALRWLPPGERRRETVKYLCFGYYDKGIFDR
jgi:hypothetical protein